MYLNCKKTNIFYGVGGSLIQFTIYGFLAYCIYRYCSAVSRIGNFVNINLMTELSFLSVRFRTTGLHTPSSPFWLDYETKLRGDSQSPIVRIKGFIFGGF